MEIGTRIRLRDVDSLEELEELHAPAPVAAGDVVAGVDEFYVLEVVLVAPGRSCIPVLARRVELEEVRARP